MTPKLLLATLCCLACFTLTAQKYELGKVSVAELEEKRHPEDTTAAAAILYKKAETVFKYKGKTGFYLEHTYEFRIKIYKKEGLSWANFSVPYYKAYKGGMNQDYVEFSDAVTFNLENGKAVKTKLGGEGRFKKDINEYWGEASIVMPNVKVGSVIEFSYKLRTEDISEFPDFDFQYDIPVKYCYYITEIPGFFVYKPVLGGFGNVMSDSKLVNGYQNYTDEHNKSQSFTYEAVKNTYLAANMPALAREKYVDNRENYRSKVKHELERTQFPGESAKLYSTTWAAVAENIYKNDRFGKELRERNYFEAYISPYIKPEHSPEQRLSAVFGYVQKMMSWNGKAGYLTDNGVRKAFAEKSGNVADINLMLVSMLSYSGLNANPVLVSTIDNGVAVFPNRHIFNYVVASVEIGGKQILLDATSKNSAPGILPLRDLNWLGWLIKNDGTALSIEMMPETQSKDIFTLMAKMDVQGKISGKMKIKKTDYLAFNFREKYKGINPDQYLEKLEKSFGVELADYQVSIPDDSSQPVEETFSINGDGGEVIGNKIYVNPLLFFTVDKNPFGAEKREMPVYFGFPYFEKYNVNIEIPAGYEVELLPKAVAFSLPENAGAFTLDIGFRQNTIQVSAKEEIKKGLFPATFYDTLKAYYEKVIKAEVEKIVLKKI